MYPQGRTAIAAAVLVLALVAPTAAGPVTKAEIQLGPPSVAGDVVSYTVTLDFQADPGYNLAYFALDVSASSPALTANSYAAFSFALDTTTLPGWRTVSNFGDIPTNLGRAEFDDNFDPLNDKPSGVYTLGMLRVQVPGVTPNPNLTVALRAVPLTGRPEDLSTNIGVPELIDFYHEVTLNPGSRPAGIPNDNGGGDGGGGGAGGEVPEPATWMLLALAAGGLAVSRRRARRVATRP